MSRFLFCESCANPGSASAADKDQYTLFNPTPVDKMRDNAMILEARNLAQSQGIAPWLDIDRENFKARVVALPRREDVQTPPMNEQLIVELYSK